MTNCLVTLTDKRSTKSVNETMNYSWYEGAMKPCSSLLRHITTAYTISLEKSRMVIVITTSATTLSDERNMVGNVSPTD